MLGWPIAAQFSLKRFILLASLSLDSFSVGCIRGFLFASYGEEAGTVGKARNWVVGGITAITVVKAQAIKELLVAFAAGPGPNEYALVIAVAITYSSFGFLYMFVQRELILNVLLAESRAERGRLEGTREAGQVVQRLLLNIPATILSGSEYIDIPDTLTKPEIAALRDQLNSSDVSKLLNQADQAVKLGNADWHVIAIAVNLHTYQAYFESNEEARLQKAKVAACWLDRALLINSRHVDFAVKRAAIAGEIKKKRTRPFLYLRHLTKGQMLHFLLDSGSGSICLTIQIASTSLLNTLSPTIRYFRKSLMHYSISLQHMAESAA